MPAPSQQWAENAKTHARSKRSLGSGNLRRLRKGVARELDRAQAEQIITARQGKFNLTDDCEESIQHWVAYAADILATGAANCHGLATLAMFYLLHNDVLPLVLVGLAPPGDHEFLVLGFDKQTHGTMNRMVTKPLEQWGDGVFICDPWAKIACRADQYHTAWLAQMTSWSGKGTTVDHKGWIDPLRQDWVSSIQQCKRTVDFSIPANYPKERLPDLTRLGLI
jgi:hypothetical protein